MSARSSLPYPLPPLGTLALLASGLVVMLGAFAFAVVATPLGLAIAGLARLRKTDRPAVAKRGHKQEEPAMDRGEAC